MKITLIDSGFQAANLIKVKFSDAVISHYFNAEEFLNSKSLNKPSSYIISTTLPGIQYTDVVKMIRYNDRISSIIMMTETVDESYKSMGSGADAFIQAPFNLEFLELMIGNCLRKTKLLQNDSIDVGIRLIPEANSLTKDGVTVSLTSREFQILNTLWVNKNEPLSRQELIAAPMGHDVKLRTIDVHVSSLRKKIERIGIVIETIRGEGYKMAC